MAAHIQRRQLADELRHIATEPSPSEVMRALEQDGLLPLFSPALAGAKLNLAGLAKLEKARRQLPQESITPAASWGPFLHVLTEKLNARKSRRWSSRPRCASPKWTPGRSCRRAPETGGSAEIGAPEEAFADIRSALEGAVRRGAVPALQFGRAADSGPHQELSAEIHTALARRSPTPRWKPRARRRERRNSRSSRKR